MNLKARGKYILGSILAYLSPKSKETILKQFSVYVPTGTTSWELRRNSFIHFYLVEQKIKKAHHQQGELEEAHKIYWANSVNYFDNFAHLIEDSYIPIYQDLIQTLAPVLESKDITQVVEFGTGDGQWLNYLANQWPFVSNFIGVDLSVHQIKENKVRFPHIQFETSDLIDWADINAQPHSLYHTMGGVLEYLSEESVRKLLMQLKEKAPNSYLFFNEPIYDDFDYTRDTHSRVVGNEYTYNHNYKFIFDELQIEMIQWEERVAFGYRVISVIGYI